MINMDKIRNQMYALMEECERVCTDIELMMLECEENFDVGDDTDNVNAAEVHDMIDEFRESLLDATTIIEEGGVINL